jgi:hypothetical protein
MNNARSNELRRRLAGLRGHDLVEALTDEIASLQSSFDELRRDMEAIEQYSLLAERLELTTGQKKSRAELPRRVEISAMEHLLPRDGFYTLEYADDGTPFRWTGPERTFSFNIYVDRQRPVQVTLEALSASDPTLLRNLEAFADGLPLPRQIQPQGDGFRLFATLQPREAVDSTQLTFVSPCVSAPKESEDNRLLGVAFTRLSLLQTEAPRIEGAREGSTTATRRTSSTKAKDKPSTKPAAMARPSKVESAVMRNVRKTRT